LARQCTVPTATTTLAQNDIRLWMTTMQASLGSSACGTIVCETSVCTVTVEWDESRSAGGSQTYSITSRSQM
ncbi:MAG: hypothetical protein REI94_21195, partial [Moraxellaceae bacterium]|nr:hypothetical protein [Moraxellaceae bacterium]